MNRKCFGTILLCAMSTLIFARESCAESNQKNVYAIYQRLREEIKNNFNETINNTMKLLQQKRLPSVTDKDFQEAVTALIEVDKMLFYNKAYIYVQCGQLAPSDVSPEILKIFIADCSRERLEALGRINARTAHITVNQPPSEVRLAGICYDRARLREAEDRFPPFDFLAGEGVNLYNVKQLDDCLGRLVKP